MTKHKPKAERNIEAGINTSDLSEYDAAVATVMQMSIDEARAMQPKANAPAKPAKEASAAPARDKRNTPEATQ